MKKLLSPWMALLTLVLMVCIRLADPSFVESVRLRYFDQLITSKGTTTSEQVHVVNIDDEFIRQKGQFPFPRGQYASIITDLYRHGAGLVVFNIYMPDPDRFNQDDQLTQALKKYPVVLPHTATNEPIENKYRPFRPGVSVIGGDTSSTGILYDNIQPNVKTLNDNAAGVVHEAFTSHSISFSGDNAILGRGLIVHANADDLHSQPAGNSGSRIACGIIGIMKP